MTETEEKYLRVLLQLLRGVCKLKFVRIAEESGIDIQRIYSFTGGKARLSYNGYQQIIETVKKNHPKEFEKANLMIQQAEQFDDEVEADGYGV